jgi:acetamidase/formamidase
MAFHEIKPDRRTLHGHFSRDLAPVLVVESGDTVDSQRSTAVGGWSRMPLVATRNGASSRAIPNWTVVDAMLDLLGEHYGMDRAEALAMAGVVVDLRITQVANGVKGVHAVLPHSAIS